MLGLLAGLTGTASAETVIVPAQTQRIDLSMQTSLFKDQGGRLYLTEVRNPAYAGRFVPGPLIVGFTRSAY